MRRALLAPTALALLLALAPVGSAATTTGVAASDIAAAMVVHPSLVTGAHYHTLSGATAVGVSDTPLVGFPTWGRTYSILASGIAGGGDTNHGTSWRGANDVTIVAIDLDVPAGANCVWFAFRFLTNDYGNFNDAFVAELDVSDWSVDTASSNAVNAPNNFAVDDLGNPIGVSTANMATGHAVGTPYVTATELLFAATPSTPGPHTLYLSVFDMYDGIYDSAVFLDGLDSGNVAPELCSTGTLNAPAAPTPELPTLLFGMAGLGLAAVSVGRRLGR